MREIRERPIIFSTELPAILDGRKMQTRRIIKPQPENPCSIHFNGHLVFRQKVTYEGGFYLGEWEHIKCPYGQVGDRLWVRETFCRECLDKDGIEDVCYREDCERYPFNLTCGEKWRPSIHMPRWASRILLEITDIRVERLQEISPRDVIAEGIIEEEGDGLELQDKFANLWDSLNAKRGYGWDKNPWVWVIRFKHQAGK